MLLASGGSVSNFGRLFRPPSGEDELTIQNLEGTRAILAGAAMPRHFPPTGGNQFPYWTVVTQTPGCVFVCV